MKGGNIYDNTYEHKAIKYIQESINLKEPLNQKSQESYGNERSRYLNNAINELKKKINILDKYSEDWRKSFYGNENMLNNIISNNSKSSSNSKTKKNSKNLNYNANNENMSGGKRKHMKQLRKTKRYRK
jgi:hypothetical protein